MSIPQEIIEAVRDATNIGDLIGEQVQLKRRGSNQTGLCPFHAEKSPSFSVNDEKGFYYCFGCGAKGNVFDFVIQTRGFSFPEAVRYLANKAGIIVPEPRRGDSEKQDKDKARRKILRDIIVAAEEVYFQALSSPEAKQAAGYLAARGLSEDTRTRYKVGFVPGEWDYIYPAVWRRLQQLGGSEISEQACKEGLLELGLLKLKSEDKERKDQRDYYDVLRNRIVFPIHRSDGMPIAFGGRTLSQEKNIPKYLNSPETLFYQKRKTLYGLYQAANAMRQSKEAYLVEGYFDVLSMSQAGFAATMATCGTAVTPDHALLLKRLVQKVVLLFDGDDAGRKAAASCFSVFQNSGLEVSAVLLPQGEDPDSLTKGNSKTAMEQLLKESAVPVVDFYLTHLRGSFGTSPAAIGKTADAFATEVAKVLNPVERESLMKRGAELLGVSFESLSALTKVPVEVARSEVLVELPSYPSDQAFEYEDSFDFGEPPAIPVEAFEPSSKGISVKQVKQIKPKNTLQQFCEQLIVSVMVEPKVAAAILNLSLSHQDGLVVDVLPKDVVAFVRDVVATDCGSLVPLGDEATQTDAESLAIFQELLIKHNLIEKNYIELALKQSRIGGVNPFSLVEDATRFATHQSIHSEVQVLRQLETGETDLTAKLKLAQDKLMKKRTLTKFGKA